MAPTGSRNSVKPSSPPGTAPSTPTPSIRGSSSLAAKSSPKGKAGVNWWRTGSGASKAAPVTEVARESISAGGNGAPNDASSSTSHSDDHSKQHRNHSLQLTKRAVASSRSLPADVATTRINIASDGSTSTPATDSQSDSADKEHSTNKDDKDSVDGAKKEQSESAGETATPKTGDEDGKPDSKQEPAPQNSGWLSWIYNSVPTGRSRPNESAAGKTVAEPSTANEDPGTTEQGDQQVVEEPNQPQPNTPETTEVRTAPQRLSWFQMWYGSSNSAKGPEQPKKEEEQEPVKDQPQSTTLEPPGDASQTSRQATPAPSERSEGANETSNAPQNPRSSGWSFWFRDPSRNSTQTSLQNGEAAEASMKPNSPKLQPSSGGGSESEQDVEVKRKENVQIKPPKDSQGPPVVPDKVSVQLEISPNAPAPKAPEGAAAKNLQKILPNQVLPHFHDTFTMQETPSLLQSIGRRLLYYNKGQTNKHVYRIRDPPRIRKALAIGVHGYFPAPLIRTVIGQPTGTSVRFSSMAADAIKKWTESRGYSCDVGKIALEGEGRISERVDLLWKLLLNYVEEIRKADYIMIASHSQGVPVSIMLVAKLIAFGCVNASRVGVCAMAGVNLGPFPDYRSRWISGSAAELFEFALPHSQVSKHYEAALRTVLDFGVRISYIGSIDDQLVSLESSLFFPVNHPYIYRAAFVDGRVHAASFLSHLIGFALKLRNLGFADHGLIRELSTPLAGSLYTGEGHSRLYDDEAVYSLAISFALETSDVSGSALQIKRPTGSLSANPYILPFAMRGLLEEEYVKRELYDETMELLKQFDEWKPSSKVLKDVKFRLEGIRSKL